MLRSRPNYPSDDIKVKTYFINIHFIKDNTASYIINACLGTKRIIFKMYYIIIYRIWYEDGATYVAYSQFALKLKSKKIY